MGQSGLVTDTPTGALPAFFDVWVKTLFQMKTLSGPQTSLLPSKTGFRRVARTLSETVLRLNLDFQSSSGCQVTIPTYIGQNFKIGFPSNFQNRAK
eukprot:3611395-Amphidinium_carterae.1